MSEPGTALYWHRQDLRLADNPALAAASQFSKLIVVFIKEPEQNWPLGAASAWWLHHSLAALKAQYDRLGQRLILRAAGGEGKSGVLAVLSGLISAHEVKAVYWNRRYEPAAMAADTAIKAALVAAGTAVTSFNALLLKEPWQHNKADGTPYKVFTPMWRRFRASYEPPAPLPPPTALPPPPASLNSASSAELGDWGLLPTIPWAAGFAPLWQPGEAGAKARLAAFLTHKLAGYDEGRDFPAKAQVSGLSPHLHFGEISPTELWRQQQSGPSGPDDSSGPDGERFLSELVWREFAYHLLFHYPTSTDQPWRPNFARFPWRSVTDGPGAGYLKAWQRGQTGVPMVDAGMRELWHTGTMHNRVRMVVASFLTKNLRIAWTHGAKWFWDTLVDADLAANSFNWQWVAGSGADAAPYFRIFNPVRQGERFDPQGDYVRRWVPELAALPSRHIHAPWLAPAKVLAEAKVALGQSYPLPVVDIKQSRAAALEAYKELSAPS